MAGTVVQSNSSFCCAGSRTLCGYRTLVFVRKPEQQYSGDHEYNAGDRDGDVEHGIDLLSLPQTRIPGNRVLP